MGPGFALARNPLVFARRSLWVGLYRLAGPATRRPARIRSVFLAEAPIRLYHESGGMVREMNFKLGLILAAVSLAGGCVYQPVQRGPAPNVVVAGDSADAVFAGQGESPGWEENRRDALFAVRPEQTLFEYDSWEGAPAPDMGRVLRVTINKSPETVTVFRRGGDYRRRTYWVGPWP